VTGDWRGESVYPCGELLATEQVVHLDEGTLGQLEDVVAGSQDVNKGGGCGQSAGCRNVNNDDDSKEIYLVPSYCTTPFILHYHKKSIKTCFGWLYSNLSGHLTDSIFLLPKLPLTFATLPDSFPQSPSPLIWKTICSIHGGLKCSKIAFMIADMEKKETWRKRA